MSQFTQHGHGGQIQCVSGVVIKGADATFAEYDLLVAPGHDVFGAHQQLLECIGQAALEQNGTMQLAQFLQQIKVLHISGTHLDQIHILEQRQVIDTHDLGHDGQACLLTGNLQQFDAVGLHPLKVVGGGTGLKGAAPQHIGSRRFDGLGDGNDLLLRLHRAGPGDHAEISAANFHTPHIHHCILRMKFAVAAFEGFGDSFDGIHDL